MALVDNLILQVYPQAGDTQIKNIVNNSVYSGTGNPVLVDEGADKAWRITTGTLLTAPIPSKVLGVSANGAGVTIAVRFKMNTSGTDDYLPLIGVSSAASTTNGAIRFTRFAASNYRARVQAGGGEARTVLSVPNGTVLTLVYRAATRVASAAPPDQDNGALWQNRVGRVGTAPDSVTYSNFTALTLVESFINCQTGSDYTLLDYAYWDRELSDEEATSVADNYRAVMPAPSDTGPDITAPSFTVAPAVSFIHTTMANVTATINEPGTIYWVVVPQGDSTPSVAQVIAGQNSTGTAAIDFGSATGATLSETATGFSASTPYKLCIVAQDDESTPNVQASVTTVNFTTAAAPQVPQGVVTIGTVSVGDTSASAPFTYSLSDQTGFQYRLNAGSATTGTPSPQNLIGLTASTAYTLEIRAINATGAGAWSAVTNFTTAATPQVPQGTFTIGAITVTETTASVPYTYSASDQTGIEYRINSGTAFTASASPQSVTGLSHSTAYTIQFRAINATGNGAWSTAANFTTATPPNVGTFTSEPLYRLVDGVLMANTSFTYYRLYNTAGALVVSKTGISSNSSGVISFTDAAVVTGTVYKSDWLTASGEFCMPGKAAT